MSYKITYKARKTSPNCDADDVFFFVDGEPRGFGYRGKNLDSIVCITRCPLCNRENYAMVVASGKCAFCGFDAKETKEDL